MNFVKKAQQKMMSGISAVASGAHAVAEKSASAVNARFGAAGSDPECVQHLKKLEEMRASIQELKIEFEKYSESIHSLGNQSGSLAFAMSNFRGSEATSNSLADSMAKCQNSLKNSTSAHFKERFGWDILQGFDEWLKEIADVERLVRRFEQGRWQAQTLEQRVAALNDAKTKRVSKGGQVTEKEQALIEGEDAKLKKYHLALKNMAASVQMGMDRVVLEQDEKAAQLCAKLAALQAEFFAKGASLFSGLCQEPVATRFLGSQAAGNDSGGKRSGVGAVPARASAKTVPAPLAAEPKTAAVSVSVSSGINRDQAESNGNSSASDSEQEEAAAAVAEAFAGGASSAPSQQPEVVDLFGGGDIIASAPPSAANSGSQAFEPSPAPAAELEDFFAAGNNSSSINSPPAPEVNLLDGFDISGGNNSSSGSGSNGNDVVGNAFDIFDGGGAAAAPPAQATDIFETPFGPPSTSSSSTSTSSKPFDPYGFDPLSSTPSLDKQPKSAATASGMPNFGMGGNNSMRPSSSELGAGLLLGETTSTVTESEALAAYRKREANKQSQEDAKREAVSSIDSTIEQWVGRGGKKNNIQTLLSSLETVLWEGAKPWKKVSLANLLEYKKVRMAYHKALVVVHPDKQSSIGPEGLARSEKVFQAINEAFGEYEQKNKK